MAGDQEPETRRDRIRVRLISIALLVAIAAFLYRYLGEAEALILRWLPNSDPGAMASFLMPAVIVLVGAGAMARQSLQVRRWPRAPGVILSSKLETILATDESGPSFRPLIRYRYTADGEKREGRTLILGGLQDGGEDWARAVLARYPAGASVSVFCDPANPARSALEASLPPLARGLLVLGLLLLFGVIYAAGLF
jgi:hypothetical protein